MVLIYPGSDLHFLEGQEFTIYTNYCPLVPVIKKKSDFWSGRQTRLLAAISEFTIDIQHVSGKDNIVADTLSHFPTQVHEIPLIADADESPGFLYHSVCNIQKRLDYKSIANDQEQDLDVQAYQSTITNLQMQAVPFGDGSYSLLCDVSVLYRWVIFRNSTLQSLLQEYSSNPVEQFIIQSLLE